MKKIFTVFGIILFFCNLVYAEVNYQAFDKDRKACYSNLSSNCFYKLIYRYSSDKRYSNILKYDYGVALMNEKEYIKAKNAFQNVVANEKENQKLIDLSRKNIKEINEHQKDIFKANSKDTGNYYKSNQSAKWKNPKGIKVYVSGRTGKEYILKRAFRTWVVRSNYAVDVVFVNNPKSADIKCSFVDTVSKTQAGVTKTEYIKSSDGKTYITKAEVKVGLLNPYGGKYTDKNLESIALHEAGHALGISYHSDNINDIMYYSTESYKNGYLSRRDVNTLKTLYNN